MSDNNDLVLQNRSLRVESKRWKDAFVAAIEEARRADELVKSGSLQAGYQTKANLIQRLLVLGEGFGV